MRSLKLAQLAFAATLAALVPAYAGPVLVSEAPWGENHDSANMDNVFGAGHWTLYGSYGAASPGSIFTGGTNFVFLEGSADSDFDLQDYVSSNGATILNWVNAGGRLLIMSAGWNISITGFGPANLVFDDYANATNCGTMTADGIAALTFEPTPSSQCGHYLAHDYVDGAGLTSFMDGDESGFAIIAGTSYGAGYIMYAGLTNSQFHDEGDPLVDDVIAFTANVHHEHGVPEPATWAMLAAALAGAGIRRRAARRTV